MPNTQIQFVEDYVRIVCALCNKYRPPIRNAEFDDTELAIRMSFLSKTTKELQKRVENEKLAAKRSLWESVDGFVMEDFFRISEDAL